ncbi:MAG: M28 family peptidase [Bryobacterales bacterium]|nr:M28 family peptidase [Bryobacterales bacterium]MDE0624585.1 M28 family peptidase [Bryobacterales bacterium]
MTRNQNAFRASGRQLLTLVFAAVAGTGIALAQPRERGTPPEEYVLAGQRAMEWTSRFVALGNRPAGSAQLRRQAEMIVENLDRLSCTVEVDRFVAATPNGAKPMRNIVARFGAGSDRPVVVISGHYDTIAAPAFVGANDGGSSAALLMVLAERFDRAGQEGVWLAFFDGEEAVVEWNDGDHTYGSRRLARRWAADGTVSRISALINVDMIGDRDLDVLYEGNSDAALRREVWDIASALGYAAEFGANLGYVQDDHVSFLEVGVPSLNLIDFNYGPRNSYWHTPRDSMDKLSERSFAIVLHVLEVFIKRRNSAQ